MKNHLGAFLLGVILPLSLPNIWYLSASLPDSPRPAGSVIQKTRYVTQEPSRFDLLFLGDSKTYCGISPDIVDEILLTRSFNTAGWGNGLISMLPQIRDISSVVKPQVTLVVIISLNNFLPGQANEQLAYPVSFASAARYFDLGVPWAVFRSTFARTIFGTGALRLFPGSYAMVHRDALLSRFRDRPEATTITPGSAFYASASELVAKLKLDPNTSLARPRLSDGHITSVEAFRDRGNYERIVLDAEFFQRLKVRSRERANQGNLGDTQGAIESTVYQNTLRFIASLLKSHGRRSIVVWAKTAPGFYQDRETQDLEEHYREVARREVTQEGVTFLSLAEENLSEDLFFDDHHLTREGSEIFSRIVALALSKVPELTPWVSPVDSRRSVKIEGS